MIKNNLKIVIPILALIVAIVIYLLSLNFTSKKAIEISANGQIKIELNHFNKIVKATGLDADGQRILDKLDNSFSDTTVVLKSILSTSNSLKPFTSEDKIDILFVSDNLSSDTKLLSYISTEIELVTTELSLNTKVNQYKLTKKDYSAVNNIKKNTGYRTFDILEQGFISKEKSPYIISIIAKGDSFFINFSREIVFNGQEKVYCYYGDKVYETSPAGYSSSTLAVFVEDSPKNVSLKFDVSIKDKDNLLGYSIDFTNSKDNSKNVQVTFSIENEKNKEKLEVIHKQILEANLSEQDRRKLLDQYEQLLGTVDRISTNEQLNDFNIMYQNLQNSLTSLTQVTEPSASSTPKPSATTKPNATSVPTVKPTAKPSPTPNVTPTPTVKPVATSTPTPKPSSTPKPSPTPVDFDKLNSSFYNELNGYKAIVLSISNTDERNNLNKQINKLYYELSISKTQEDYDKFEENLEVFLTNLQPYRR